LAVADGDQGGHDRENDQWTKNVSVSALALSLTDHLISGVYVVSDQRKLAHVKRALEQQQPARGRQTNPGQSSNTNGGVK